MKPRLPIYRGLALCLSSVLLQAVVPSLAIAAAPTVMHSTSLTADYTFFGNSSDVEVSAGQGTNPNGGQPTLVSIQANDFSNNTFTCYSANNVPLTSSQFQIDSSFQSATLDIVGLVLQDCYTGNPVTGDISLKWTGVSGPPSRYSGTSRVIQGPYADFTHSTGLSRSATVSGTLVINGINFLVGDPVETFADLSKVSSTSVIITKNPS